MTGRARAESGVAATADDRGRPNPDVGRTGGAALVLGNAPEGRATELAVAKRLFAEARRDEKIRASHAPSTRRAYAADWVAFRAWCERMTTARARGYALPATDAVLATWVGALDCLALSTVRRKLSAVRLAHVRLGHPLPADLPATDAALRGHAREQADRAPRRQTAATAPVLVRLVDTLDGDASLHAARNRAVLLVGFDAALRRSEIVGLDHEHLARTEGGYLLRLPRTKGATPGKAVHVALLRQPTPHYCPVAALDAWLERAERVRGPVFVGLGVHRESAPRDAARLSERAVARIVQAAARAAGLDGPFAGHSLRRGQITGAVEAGVALHRIQAHARHRDLGTTLAYVQTRDARDNHPRLVIGGATDVGATNEKLINAGEPEDASGTEDSDQTSFLRRT